MNKVALKVIIEAEYLKWCHEEVGEPPHPLTLSDPGLWRRIFIVAFDREPTPTRTTRDRAWDKLLDCERYGGWGGLEILSEYLKNTQHVEVKKAV